MQFFCFKPEGTSLWLQFRHSSNDHAKKMLGFTRFFSTGANAFEKFFFRDCVIGFYVIGANTFPAATS